MDYNLVNSKDKQKICWDIQSLTDDNKCLQAAKLN